MEFRFGPEQERLRADVREFLAEHWAPPDRPVRYRPGYLPDARLERELGRRGWLGLTWPVEYGGGGRSPIDNLVVAEELAAVSAPGVETLGYTSVGPSLLAYGNEEQKQDYIGGLCRGEVSFCLGYSEPGTGSDLAGLQAEARLDGDHYVVNGRKVWTSGARQSTHCWMAVRTGDDSEIKHRGISVLVVPMDSPGITIRPLVNMAGDADFNEVTFEDVLVPRKNLVGEEGGGWRVLTAALATERVGLYPAWAHRRLMRAVTDVLRRQTDPVATVRRAALANLYCECEAARMLTYRAAYLDSRGELRVADAAQLKLFNSELSQRVYAFAVSALGLEAQAWADWMPELGRLAAHGHLDLVQASLGGGTSEIQRTLIAVRGLGMPRE
jgi:alkylation response protein AidB-like acyl-CoA dehydrogenase